MGVFRSIQLGAGLLALVLVFQNCAKNPHSITGAGANSLPSGVGAEEVVSPASQYSQVRSVDLFVSLDSNQVQNIRSGKSCALDTVREQSFRALFSQARVCRPERLKADEVACLAIGISDLELSNSRGESLKLTPYICRHGLDLCGDDRVTIRELMESLSSDPPPGC